MYIEQGYRGKTDSWLYLLGIILVFIVWQVFGGVPLITAAFAKGVPMNDLASGDIGIMADALGTNTFLFFMLLSFLIGIIGLLSWTRFVHNQKIKFLTTSRHKIDVKRIFFSFVLWAVISVLFIVLDVWLSPDDYKLNFNLEAFSVLAAIAIVMIPIQTSMEEYFLRGYMMQGIGIVSKNRLLPLLFTSILFGVMHIFNPEVAKLGYGIMVFYIGTGFFLGILTLMDEGLELALGFHAANNLITALLVTADWTAFQTDSIYRDVSEPVLGFDVLIPVFVVYPILLFIYSKKYRWTNWKERLTGKVLSREEFFAKEKSIGNLS